VVLDAFECGAEAVVCDVGVALGGGDARVSQECLDVADVEAVFEEEGGGGVAEHVRGYLASEAGVACGASEEGAYILVGEGSSVVVDEQAVTGDSAEGEVAGELPS
jgi:hypothetical protein